MTDLEGLTRALLKKGRAKELSKEKVLKREIIEKLIEEYKIYKKISENKARSLAEAVFDECVKSNYKGNDEFLKMLLEIPKSEITVGKQGVGCRGAGDFFIHKLIGDVSSTSNEAYLSPKSLDDAGAVFIPEDLRNITADKFLIVSKMEGMHSRLSDFPFIAGFHVTRAALRDLLVKGARPISIFVDIHLGDDSDVGKLFDFMSGISAVSELANVPITGGSTLRIGGDMVIGTRITGGIGAVGVCTNILARRNIKKGDRILMTEGAGGGTIATTAIYSGNHEVVKETININFLKAVNTILKSKYIPEIHAMCDVTNGGLRGDLFEINFEAKTGVKIYEERISSLVNPKVLALLEKTGVDYLGVSLDALLLYVSPEVSNGIISMINNLGIKIAEIGVVNDTGEVVFINKKGETKIIPRFRESAYTKVKQVIGESTPESIKVMEKKIEGTAKNSIRKRDKIVEYIRNNQ
ncbi:MAG: AIR synthase-related protein [Promethearchaeota archaeon]